jgi:hypothetical protein
VATDTSEPSASHAENDIDREQRSAVGLPRFSRRLSDKILIAFHHACYQADLEVAGQLVSVLEMMLSRRPVTFNGKRRHDMDSLLAAHARLWHLRNPHGDELP